MIKNASTLGQACAIASRVGTVVIESSLRACSDDVRWPPKQPDAMSGTPARAAASARNSLRVLATDGVLLPVRGERDAHFGHCGGAGTRPVAGGRIPSCHCGDVPLASIPTAVTAALMTVVMCGMFANDDSSFTV